MLYIFQSILFQFPSDWIQLKSSAKTSIWFYYEMFKKMRILLTFIWMNVKSLQVPLKWTVRMQCKFEFPDIKRCWFFLYLFKAPESESCIFPSEERKDLCMKKFSHPDCSLKMVWWWNYWQWIYCYRWWDGIKE